MSLVRKLLGLLNRVWDKDPGAFLALRLQSDGDLGWSIEDGVLSTVPVGGTAQPLQVDLSAYDLSELATFLAAQAGYTVPFVCSPDVSILSALVLLDAAGDTSLSNGDQIFGYSNPNWAYMEAAAVELRAAKTQIEAMPAEMNTVQSDGEWLDLQGSYYVVPRTQGENDLQYGPRIPATVLRPKGNNVAIEIAIEAATGQAVTVDDFQLTGTGARYNGVIRHDGSHTHNGSLAGVTYGLFLVSIGFDLVGSTDLAGFQTIAIGLVEKLRDAGTQLWSLSLEGSELSDPAGAAPVDGVALAMSRRLFYDQRAKYDGSFDHSGIVQTSETLLG